VKIRSGLVMFGREAMNRDSRVSSHGMLLRRRESVHLESPTRSVIAAVS
jgi:hypothetical protein